MIAPIDAGVVRVTFDPSGVRSRTRGEIIEISADSCHHTLSSCSLLDDSDAESFHASRPRGPSLSPDQASLLKYLIRRAINYESGDGLALLDARFLRDEVAK